MRLPSNRHLTRQQPTPSPTDTSSGARGARGDKSEYQGIHPKPAHSTSTRGRYIANHITPQRFTPESMRAQGHPHALSRAFHGHSYPALGAGVGVFHAQSATRDTPTPSLYTPFPYSAIAHQTAIPMTWMGGPEAPPPLDHNKSPYGCIPLPDITPGPDIPTINPILAYAPPHSPDDVQTNSQGHRYHMCAPATIPKLGIATILLPDGRGITVHASLKGHDFVTVGDVLDALDMILLGRPLREVSLPANGSYDGMDGSCWYIGERHALGSLRSRHGRAGLTRSEEGLDIWELRIG